MRYTQKDIEAVKINIAEMDEAIYELTNTVEIVGELDQDRKLIISENETLPEAVKRQKKLSVLQAKKNKLEITLAEFKRCDIFGEI